MLPVLVQIVALVQRDCAVLEDCCVAPGSILRAAQGVICDSLESSITDSDQRIFPTAMQTVSWCRRSEECGDAFHQREETQQLFACHVSVDSEPEGITKHRHFRRVHQNSLHENSMPDLCRHAADTTAAFRADTTAQVCRCCCDDQRQKPCELFAACHDELMWRIEDAEDAAKKQTARNPEFTVLDSVGTSGRGVGDEDRDGES